MRPLLAILLGLAMLSGCLDDETLVPDEAPQAAFPGSQFQGEASAGVPAGTAQAHGEPDRVESDVETGGNPLLFPGAYARKTVTITNDFGGASLGVLAIGISAGTIAVVPGNGPGYELVAVLTAHAATEQEARTALDRITLSHEDILQPDGLHLTTGVRYEPAPMPVPFIVLGGGTWTEAQLTFTVPAGPAYDLWAYASSGDILVEGLRGPSFRLDTSSGAITATGLNAGTLEASASSGGIHVEQVQAAHVKLSASSGDLTAHQLVADILEADASSGDIEATGRFGDLDVSASSGNIVLEAEPLRSGHYALDASSGSLDVRVALPLGVGYDVTAETSSGTITIDLPNAEVLETDDDGDYQRVATAGFTQARTQVVIEADTSSGDITVSALSAGGIL